MANERNGGQDGGQAMCAEAYRRPQKNGPRLIAEGQ